jgi:RNA polymerase sigma factor (sigma-70 family)
VGPDGQGTSAAINVLHKAVASGDSSAQERLFGCLTARFRLFVRLRITDRQDAEDVVQDALATIIREYRDMTFSSSFAAWAYKVLDNKVLSYIQSQSRRARRIERDPPEYVEAEADLPDPRLKSRLLNCLKQILKVNQRYARSLSLHYQGYGTEDICRRLDIKANTFYSLLSRARTMLDNCLETGEVSR